MRFFSRVLLPGISGFAVASFFLSLFEAVNHVFFPLPKDIVWSNLASVHAMSAAVPPSAYVLLCMGWLVSSYAGGLTIRGLTVSPRNHPTMLLGGVLTFCGGLTIVLLGQPELVAVVGLPLLCIGTYIGSTVHIERIARRAFLE